jgi:hypothetical protein
MYCLAIAREILRGDGYLFVCNWNLFDHYMAPYAGDPEGFYGATRRVLGEVLSWEHPHYFHAASFRYMVESAGFEILDFEFDSQIRPRHMGVLARPAVEVVASRPAMAAVDVIARLRALESAAVAARVSERLQPSEKRQK